MKRENTLPQRRPAGAALADVQHTTHFETFEERLPLSADPVADFRLLPSDLPQVHDQADWVELAALTTTASEGHGWTDVAAVRNNYGLTGSKQTVAIIDSGIAYDHLALGGGLGRAYRVVGGWDFAENDANPYDDGPAGFHGTHVAGIVGSGDKRYTGVAKDVDLVSLRVFDDQGNGYFQWVESALRWVHEHRFDFENPITTVNLSLGTEWNAATLPNWASLEDELRTLENDGIFISVAAGNSFKNYNQTGLSYPAVSQYVVPVASVGKNGLLSAFSQRDARVLAAPGEKVMSSLPDHFYGGDGYKNDWGASSGTSMAAPYVAGASVLMREALFAMGQTNVNQDLIYDRLYASADIVYDPITGGSYRSVNLQRALQGVVGVDEFGSTSLTSHSLGSLGSSRILVSGTVNGLQDKDFFSFQAERSGSVTLVMQQSGNLAGVWTTAIAGAQISGNRLTMNVIAGQTYTFGLGTQTGIGKYTLQSEFVAAAPTTPAPPVNTTPPANTTPPPTNTTPPPASSGPFSGNFGVVNYAAQNNLKVSGQRWMQVTAGRSGLLTVEALHSQAGGNVRLELYNSQKLLLRSIDGVTGVERLDINAGAGSVYFVRLVGSNADVDVRVTNMLTLSGSTATIYGSAANDTFVFSAQGSQKQIIVNGTTYAIGSVARVNFQGNGGTDTATLIGGSAAERATLRAGRAELRAASYLVTVQAEMTSAVGGQGDTVTLYENTAADRWGAAAGQVWVTGNGYQNLATGFGSAGRVYKTGSFNPGSLAASPATIGSENDSNLAYDSGIPFAHDFASPYTNEEFRSTNSDRSEQPNSTGSNSSRTSLLYYTNVQIACFAAEAHSAAGITEEVFDGDGVTDKAEESEIQLTATRTRELLKADLGAVEQVFEHIGSVAP